MRSRSTRGGSPRSTDRSAKSCRRDGSTACQPGCAGRSITSRRPSPQVPMRCYRTRFRARLRKGRPRAADCGSVLRPTLRRQISEQLQGLMMFRFEFDNDSFIGSDDAFSARTARHGRGNVAIMTTMAASALALLLLSAGDPRAAETTDLVALLAQAERVQKSDTEAWARYRFHRRHLKEYLDEEGHTTKTQDLAFEVTPASKGFEEVLVKQDGRIPTADEVAKGRREAKFSK